MAFGKDFQNQLRKDIIVEPGKVTEVSIIAPKKASMLVKGKVLDEEGVPLANVKVRVRGQSNMTVQGRISHAHSDTSSDGEGNFTFAVYETGRYDLTIYVDGFEPANVNGVIVGDESVKPEFVVRLKRADRTVDGKGSVEVQVLSADGKPMPQVWVVPVRKDEENPFGWDWQIEKAQFTDRQGKVRFIGLQAGSYFFAGIATQPDLPIIASSPTVAVAKGQETKVSFSFPKTGRIIGKLVDERGNPIAGEAVGIWTREVFPEDEWRGFYPFQESTVTRSDGSFVFEFVPEGVYTFSTSFGFPRGMVTTGQSISVRGGKTVKATVKVYSSVPVATIEGEVIDSNGNPVPNAVVFVNSEPMRMVVTDEKGQFVFSNLPTLRYGTVATYSVTAQKQGFAPRTETVKVGEGKKVEVRLMLENGGVVEGQLLDEKGEPVGGMPVYIVPKELACAG